MGYASYSTSNRAVSTAMYQSMSVDDTFTQNAKRETHSEMDPDGIVLRESHDSDEHPNTVPIQIYLDVTGSMGHIPHDMIKTGLPTLVGTLIQNGVKDPALMFGAIGDHECDQFPLQVAQFESGDTELDMWLTRTFLEGGGGGNAGESYLLAWYFAAYHTRTDAWDNRGKKGYIFTIGDEPSLDNLPENAVKEIMGESAVAQGSYNINDLLDKAGERNHVYHISLEHSYRSTDASWKQMLGDHCIIVKDYKEIPVIISKIILEEENGSVFVENLTNGDTPSDIKNSPVLEEIL